MKKNNTFFFTGRKDIVTYSEGVEPFRKVVIDLK